MLELKGVSKEYRTAAGPIPVLDGIDLTLQRGEAIAVMGPSGSGKSTLLHILGALDAPSSGTVRLDGRDPFVQSEKDQALFRNRHVGFVFQDHALLPQCTAVENVIVPVLVAERSGGEETRARQLLERVGLASLLHKRPAELSGGEKQRVAIARALIRKPLLLLCDEPTGNLDRASADNIASLLLEVHEQQNTILVVVTHSREIAVRMGSRYELRDRRLIRL